MIKVKNVVKTIKHDTNSLTLEDSKYLLLVGSCNIRKSLITIAIGDVEVLVNAKDLQAAIENSKNDGSGLY